MARCRSCKKYLGLGLFSKWVPLDGHCFCGPCSEIWRQQRRQCILKEIFDPGNPVELFHLPQVSTKNPDRPQSRELLLGSAIFMDTGVCFVQYGCHQKADTGWGLAFGLIGMIVAESSAKRRQQRASEESNRRILENAGNLTGLLNRANRLLFYPREDINRLKFNSSGFDIRMGKLRKRFAFDGGRKVFKQFRDIADTYRQAIENKTDPVLACKHATPFINH
ncbi:MAG: hypothetical protein K8S55_05745 [Phycisphaerae bacterium]|nr:hypothetical protein [Phycisphaerae bacterium]